MDAEDCRANVNSKPGRYVRLTVSDTGTGMSPEVLSRIFEPFFSTKEVGKGTGLGLAMVYGVVQQHGGIIRVRSEPGQGSAFEIYLPTVDAVSEAAVAPSSDAVSGGTETILVAEDDPAGAGALWFEPSPKPDTRCYRPRTGRRRSKCLPITPPQSRWCCST